MKVRAPGKLLLSGAYAVLEGSPALVIAVDRYAVADAHSRATSPTPEVLAAMSAEDAPEVNALALREGAFKLGLGSSAAMLVASLGVAYFRAGRDLVSRNVRNDLVRDARLAHGRVQGGGSGVDVAASVFGGALDYRFTDKGEALVELTRLPKEVVLEVFWCGAPAVTTSMRARVCALRARDASVFATRMAGLAEASVAALAAAASDDTQRFVNALGQGAEALFALGRDADAPIVPPQFQFLAPLADLDGAAFFPSGAGGGDVFVHVGRRGASPRFIESARRSGMTPVPMRPDLEGVRLVP